jgi:hypothetical protein
MPWSPPSPRVISGIVANAADGEVVEGVEKR